MNDTVTIRVVDIETLAAALAAAKTARGKADNAFAILRCKLAEFEEVLTQIKIQELK